MYNQTIKSKSKVNLQLYLNIFFTLFFIGVSQIIQAQSPVRFLSATTHLGGYHIKCNGQNSGVIDATPNFGTAPYTFLWNTGDTAAKLTNKSAGIYIVTAKDVNNVSRTDTFELKQPYSLNYQSSLSNIYGYNISKNGNNDGFIELTPNGGLPPYKYQ